jgi:ubiquinone/menaquinone biosynthesis C-methylase UbiE
MKKIIDNFSTQATIYQKYRPVYPPELYEFIFKQVKNKHKAWDCGTGNGQVANILAKHFSHIEATDISENQLKNAPAKDNITYSRQRAEHTNFPNQHFDLISVGQAIHWFDFEPFYKEVQRVAKKDAILAIFGYGLLRIDGINDDIDHFYYKIIGPYWNKERRHIDNAYSSIPFPFTEIQPTQDFFIKDTWTIEQLEGYLNTWSSVQRFIKKEGFNPVNDFIKKLQTKWGTTSKSVAFPILIKLARL